MTEFMVELYVPRTDPLAAARCVERARRSANELAHDGAPVRYLRSIYVPEDETCFLLYEAASADAVREAVRRAALPCDHVAEAVSVPER